MKSFLYYFRIKTLLNKNQRKKFDFLIFLTLITMCLEVLGISLVVPIVTLLSGVQSDFNLPFLDNLSYSEIIFTTLAMLVLIVTVKVSFISFFEKKIHNFYTDLRVTLSEKIYSIYLNKPYEFHLSKNSSTLIRNIEDVKWFVVSVKYLLFLIAECIMVIGVFSFILLYEPIGAISSISFLGFFGYIIYKSIQSQTKKLGSLRRFHDEFKFLFLQQGFHAIKDIKVKNKENSFIKQFSYHNNESTQNEFKYSFIQTLPRLFLEWLLVIGIVLLISIIFIQKQDLVGILPILGLFLVAALRLMPSITRIMNSIQTIKFGEAVIDSLNDEIKINKNLNKESKEDEKIIFNKYIEIQDISFGYKNSEKKILSGINLKISFGDTIGLLGLSGSGKTTLINIILGLLRSSKGKILVDGINIHRGLKSWQNNIGYVPQNIYLTDDSLQNNIAFGSMNEKEINLERVKKAIRDAQLEKLVSSLKNGVNTKLGEFGERISGGERQRIGIARALYNNPKLLILDESTNSLDFETEEKILEDVVAINKEMTIIMIAHRPSTLSKCNRIFRLSESKLTENNLKN